MTKRLEANLTKITTHRWYNSKGLLAVLLFAIAGTIAIGFGFAGTPPITYYVSTSGNDANAGSQAAPFRTIQRGVNALGNGDILMVNSGTYTEHSTNGAGISIGQNANGATVRGYGATKPVIDGANNPAYPIGINMVNGVHDLTFDNFEIRNIAASASQEAVGIQASVTSDSLGGMSNELIENLDIHDIHSLSQYSYGIKIGSNPSLADPAKNAQLPASQRISVGLMHDNEMKNNLIHDIGPGGESKGIWILYNKNSVADGNEIYRVRKEGIRDWNSLNTTISSNRIYLTWDGLTMEGSIGGLVVNNYFYNNVYGFVPKHVSSPGTLDGAGGVNPADASLPQWGMTTGQWTRFWHNTTYQNTHADTALGMNGAIDNMIDIRDNILASPGDVHLHDYKNVRTSAIIVDGNAYSGAAPVHYEGDSLSCNGNFCDFYQDIGATSHDSGVRAILGWERNGQDFTPNFTNSGDGDFRFNSSGLGAGVPVGDSYGSQVGARLTTTATHSWTHYNVKTIASSAPTPSNLAGAADGTDLTRYWYATGTESGWQTYDLSTPKKINTFVVDIFKHPDGRAPKDQTIQVSNDNVNWTTVYSTPAQDYSGSSQKYVLNTPVTARYVKYTFSNWSTPTADYGAVVISDFIIGDLEANTNTPPPPPNNPPLTGLTSPTAGQVFTAPATVNISAAAGDSDGTVTKVEYFEAGNKLGEDTTAPYSFNWTNVAAGNYTITAKATDNDGATYTSAPITISVKSGNIPSLVGLTAPVVNQTYTAPATVHFAANAGDPDGTVTKVEFFQGFTKVGEDTSAPYVFDWTNVATGNYTVWARATDNTGATSQSPLVDISVNPPVIGNPCTVIGDITCDGKVDFRDLSGLIFTLGTNNATTDFNHDGIVDFRDISFLIGHFSG